MKRNCKRVISMFLAVLMSVSLFAMDFTTAKAEGIDEDNQEFVVLESNVDITEDVDIEIEEISEEATEEPEVIVTEVESEVASEVESEEVVGESEEEFVIDSEVELRDVEEETEFIFTEEILLNAPSETTMQNGYSVSLKAYETYKDKYGNATSKSGTYSTNEAITYPCYGECLVVQSVNSLSQIQWYRNGEPVSNKEKYTDTKANEYVLSKNDIGAVISCSFIAGSDTSKYYCLATEAVQKGFYSFDVNKVTVDNSALNQLVVYDCNPDCEYALVEESFEPSFSSNDLAYLKGNKGAVNNTWTVTGLRINTRYVIYARFPGNDVYDAAQAQIFNDVIGMGRSTCSHSYKNEWFHDGAYHYRKCLYCGKVDAIEGHLDNNGDGKCDVCGEAFVRGELMVEYKATGYTYTGSAIKPEVTIYDGTQKLTEGKDYTLQYVNNVNAYNVTTDNDPKAPTIKITGKGNYAGSILNHGKTCTFSIEKMKMTGNGGAFTISDENKIYEYNNGKNISVKPTVSWSKNDKTIKFKSGTDYDIEYKLNGKVVNTISQVGKYDVLLTFKGNYSGAVGYKFEVADKKNVSTLKLTAKDVVYTGGKVFPQLMLNNAPFDYSVVGNTYDFYVSSCSNNVNVGTATIVLTANENNDKYYGSRTITYKIKPMTLTADDCIIKYKKSVTQYSFDQNSNKLDRIEITYYNDVKSVRVTLEEGVDYKIKSYKNLNTLTPTVDIQLMGNYTGTISDKYTLGRINIEDTKVGDIYVSTEAQVMKAEPKVVVDGVVLKKGTDYQLGKPEKEYENWSFYTCDIRGLGKYSGGTSFKIYVSSDKKNLSQQKIVVEDEYYNCGKEIKPTWFYINGVHECFDDSCITYYNNKGQVDKTTTATAVISLDDADGEAYVGTAVVTFKILPNNLKNATIEKIMDEEYAGIPIKPEIKVTLNGYVIDPADGFTVEYSNNENVGKAKVKVVATGDGKFTGSKETTFNIVQRYVTAAEILSQGIIINEKYNNASSEWGFYAHEWNKNGVKPEPVIWQRYTTNGHTYTHDLVKGKDYDVTYKNNNKVGTATATITFKGNYKGTSTRDYIIVPKKINGTTIDNVKAVYNTDEKKNVPSPKVVVDGVTLVKDKDYYITNESGSSVPGSYNPGRTTLAVRGMGNYEGVSEKFDYILTVNLSNAKLKSEIGSWEYTGERISPDFKICVGSKTVDWHWYTCNYSNNINAGTAKVKVESISEYATGSKEFTYKITPVPAEKVTVKGSTVLYYSPDTAKNILALNGLLEDANGRKLVSGVDFTISYKNNNSSVVTRGDKIPTAVCTLKGNYSGKKDVPVEILPRSMTDAVITGGTTATYNGNGKQTVKINPTLVVDGKTLTYGKDYYITKDKNGEWDKNTKGCFYDVTGTELDTYYAVGMGNYSGSLDFVYYVLPKDKKLINSLTIDKIPDQAYTGDELKPLIYSNGALLSSSEYDIKYIDNVGDKNKTTTATVQIRNKGITQDYIGYKTVTFKIVPNDLKNAQITFGSPEKVYTGSPILQSFVVTCNNKSVISSYYDVEYANNINVGTARIKITARDNSPLIGSKEFTFKIVKYDAGSDLNKMITVNKGNEMVVAWNGGNTRKPEPEVKFGNTVLTKGTDYTLSYSNTSKAADKDDAKAPTLNIAFKGQYSGTYKVTYTIVSDTLYNPEITIADKKYDPKKSESWKQTTISVKTKTGGKTLKLNTDYEIVGYYADPYTTTKMQYVGASTIEKGMDVYVKIKGIGNYKFEKIVSYHEAPNSISDLKITVANKIYTGNKIQLAGYDLSFKNSQNKVVYANLNMDYKIDSSSYSNNTNVGTATVIIKGTGAYCGEKKIQFKIVQRTN